MRERYTYIYMLERDDEDDDDDLGREINKDKW